MVKGSSDLENSKPVKIKIDEMEEYFKKEMKGDLRLYNYFQSMIELVSLMCLMRNYKGILPLAEMYPLDFTIDCFLKTSARDSEPTLVSSCSAATSRRTPLKSNRCQTLLVCGNRSPAQKCRFRKVR